MLIRFFSANNKEVSKYQAFTLIEVLVVAAIISLVSSIIVSSTNEARSSARDAQRQTDLNSIRSGMAIFFDNNDRYPSNYSELETVGTMNNIPTDPTKNTNYPFATSSTGFDICIAACMEDAANGGGSSICDVDNGVTYSNQGYIDGNCDPANEFYISF